jgi:HEAT repeat protein
MPLIRKPPEPAPAQIATFDGVVDALQRGNNEQRWTAAREAAQVPSAAPALGRALLSEVDVRVREAIFTSLARIGNAESAQAVLPHLRSDDASMRTGALDALRAMPEQTRPLLARLLNDTDPDVRLLTCELARSLPGKDSVRLLCQLLETEPVANVCSAAVDVLAEIAGAEAMPALARCAERFRNDPFFTFAVEVAIKRVLSETPGMRG